MICQVNKFQYNRVSVIFFIFFTSIIWSQEAEKIYHEKYSKLSFVIQPAFLNKFQVSGTDNKPSVQFKKNFSYQFGVYYNFAQYKNLNIKTGLIAKSFSPKLSLNVSEADLSFAFPGTSGALNDFYLTEQYVISVPIKVEYFLKLHEKLNLTFGFGINADLRTGRFSENELRIEVTTKQNNGSREIFKIESNEPKITASSDFSIGANYKSNWGLIQLEVFYNGQLLSYAADGVYYFKNLDSSLNKTGVFTVYGNYYGVSLQITPKKGWLKRKNNPKN